MGVNKHEQVLSELREWLEEEKSKVEHVIARYEAIYKFEDGIVPDCLMDARDLYEDVLDKLTEFEQKERADG